MASSSPSAPLSRLSCQQSCSLTVALLTLGGENEAVELTAQEVSLLFQVFDAFLQPRVLFQRNLQLCAQVRDQQVGACRSWRIITYYGHEDHTQNTHIRNSWKNQNKYFTHIFTSQQNSCLVSSWLTPCSFTAKCKSLDSLSFNI